MYLTNKIRIYPTKKQKDKLDVFFRIKAFIYNKSIEYMNEKNDSNITDVDKFLDTIACSKLTGKKKEIFNEFPITWQRKIVNRAKRAFNTNKKFKTKCKMKSVDENIQTFDIDKAIVLDNDKKKAVYVSKLGFLKARYIRKMDGRVYNCMIKREAGNNYYIHIVIDVTSSSIKHYEAPHHHVGLDLGLKTLVTTSDGDKYDSIHFYSDVLKRANRIRKKMARQIKESSNYKKSRLLLQRLYCQMRHRLEDYHHKVSLDIIKKNSFIAIESFTTKELMQKPGNKLDFNNQALSSFLEKLAYKAMLYNRVVQEIDKYYPSSQICSNCGHRDRSLKDLSIREFNCEECGIHQDRDVNAAKNILKEGIKEYKFKLRSSKKKKS